MKQAARDFLTERLDRGDSPPAILVEMQTALDDAPGRSTFYRWVRTWRDARALDTSGQWSLATDETGRAELVMRVLAALSEAARTRAVKVTNAEAKWIVRIGTMVEMEPLKLRGEALRYVDAEVSGEPGDLAELDVRLAYLYLR